jgi:hypothetical protein
MSLKEYSSLAVECDFKDLPKERIDDFFKNIEEEDFYLYLIMLFTENRDLMKSITNKITDIFLKNLVDPDKNDLGKMDKIDKKERKILEMIEFLNPFNSTI